MCTLHLVNDGRVTYVMPATPTGLTHTHQHLEAGAQTLCRDVRYLHLPYATARCYWAQHKYKEPTEIRLTPWQYMTLALEVATHIVAVMLLLYRVNTKWW
jgi:hypothetical protein